MRVLPFIVMVCIVGCNGQSTTNTGPQDSNVNPRKHELTPLAEKTVGDIILEPKTVINGRVSLLIPWDFTLMDEETLRLKYPSDRRPTVVYTDDTGAVNVAINHTNTRLPQSELAAFLKHMDSMFRNLYPSATWFKSEIVSINGREWFILELRTPAIDTEIRNIILCTSLDDRQLLVSFNVTKELEETWLEPAGVIVQSIQVAD